MPKLKSDVGSGDYWYIESDSEAVIDYCYISPEKLASLKACVNGGRLNSKVKCIGCNAKIRPIDAIAATTAEPSKLKAIMCKACFESDKRLVRLRADRC